MALDSTWNRQEAIDLHDPFEPTYIRTELMGTNNLGHLVFGASEFQKLGGTLSARNDPLTALYSNLSKCTIYMKH